MNTKISAFFGAIKQKVSNTIKATAAVATAVLVGLGVKPAASAADMPLATIDVTPFTDQLSSVGTAVTGALGATVTAALAVAGVIMAGLLLWRLFKRVAKS